MSRRKVPMTREGYSALEGELKYLIQVQRPRRPRRARRFTLQPRGFFASRHGNLGKCQGLSHERVTPVAFKLEIGADGCHTRFETILFHFERRKLGLHPLDVARIGSRRGQQ